MARAFPDLAKYRQATTGGSASNEVTTIDLSSWDIPFDRTNAQPPEKRARLMDSSNVVANGRNAAGGSNQVDRKGNVTTSMKVSLRRNMDSCFHELMAMEEHHTISKMNLKTEFDAKLAELQRDHDRRVEELKKKFWSKSGF